MNIVKVTGGTVLLPDNGLKLALGNADGSPITSSQLPRIQIYASSNPNDPLDLWQRIDTTFTLANGVVQITGLSVTNPPSRFFRAVQTR